MRSYLQRKGAVQRQQIAVIAATRQEPKPDHAAILTAAVANTVASAPRPPLGVLLWPGGYPLHSIETDLGARHSRFRVVIDDVMKSWQHLFGADRTELLFDPHGLSQRRGGFAARVRGHGFAQVVTGVEACRALVTLRLQAEARG